jgi:hypothetical protein
MDRLGSYVDVSLGKGGGPAPRRWVCGARGGRDRVSLTTIPGMGHAFAAEPGVEPAPQGAEAKLVDAAVTDWLSELTQRRG